MVRVSLSAVAEREPVAPQLQEDRPRRPSPRVVVTVVATLGIVVLGAQSFGLGLGAGVPSTHSPTPFVEGPVGGVHAVDDRSTPHPLPDETPTPRAAPPSCTRPPQVDVTRRRTEFSSSWLTGGALAPKGVATSIERGTILKPVRFHVYDVPAKYIQGALDLLPKRWATSVCNRHATKTNYTMLDWRHAHSLFTADVAMAQFLRHHPAHTTDPEEADAFVIPMMAHLYNCAGVMHYAAEVLSWVVDRHPATYRRMQHHDHFLFWWRWGMHYGATKRLLKKIATHFPNVNFISYDFLELQGRNEFQDFSLSLKPNFDRAKDWIVVPYPDFAPKLQLPLTEEERHRPRDVLFFFSGTATIGGVRRWIQRACEANPKDCHFAGFAANVVDTKRLQVPDYPTGMRQATFCGHAAGDALSSRRPTSAVLAGCIPVLICDLCLYPWESFIDYSTFAVFVHEDDVMDGKLFDILRGIPPERVRAMQKNLAAVRRRFVYNMTHPPQEGDALDSLATELTLRGRSYRQYRRWHRRNEHLSAAAKDYPPDPCALKRYIRAGVTSSKEESNFNNMPR